MNVTYALQKQLETLKTENKALALLYHQLTR